MKITILSVLMTVLLACNNKSSTTKETDTLKSTNETSNAAPIQGDTSSYERMSNSVDSSLR